MNEEKDMKQKQEEAKKRTNPGDIEGKLEVPDTRERRDGPGGD